jgi:hypothetical protein
MITNHRRVVWAEELGIDMKKLREENPDRWEQIMMKKRLGKQAEDYWARARYLERMESLEEQPEPKKTPVKRKKTPMKRTNIGKYEFTDAQLEIAYRSLNAGGRV